MAFKPFYNSRAPAIPTATPEYSQNQQDQVEYALRIYFNRLDSALSSLAKITGGALLGLPHVAASDTTDQYATASNTATKAAWNVLESGNGFTLNLDGSATASISGIYKITFSLQLANTANAIHDATVWLRVNNVDIANSATIFSIPARKSAGNPSYLCGYSEVVFSMNAGDSMTLYWATDQAYSPTGPVDGVYMFAEPAQTSPYARPAVPSAIGSITFVSALPT